MNCTICGKRHTNPSYNPCYEKEIKQKAQKYDELMKANSEIVKNNINHTQIFQDNKNLKAELEQVSDKLGNELQEKYLEIEEFKQKIDRMVELLDRGNSWNAVKQIMENEK